jgi:L-ascorbate metabolism protein UlaG (beta-lactamase superfamily)
MEKLSSILKMIAITVGIVILVLIVCGSLFLYLSPQFGGRPNAEQKKKYALAPNYSNGKFINQTNTEMHMDLATIASVLRDQVKGIPNSRPSSPLPIVPVDSLYIQENMANSIIWFGHSSFFVKLNGLNILIDPMFGDAPAPHPMVGGKRFEYELPIIPEKLPEIEVVVYSHDHYDHLDYSSVRKLKDKVKQFYVPLGVGAHLKAWGVANEKIHEMNWDDSVKYNGITFICTPARHFSGRSLTDRNASLWSSWVIKSSDINLYFSGDSGYGPHFKTIGKTYGPFDLALLECGQYDKRWENIHMLPEQTVMAAKDVQAKLFMPIHWGAFRLAMHPWTDPIERVGKPAKEIGIPYIAPKIGEVVKIGEGDGSVAYWWRGL